MAETISLYETDDGLLSGTETESDVDDDESLLQDGFRTQSASSERHGNLTHTASDQASKAIEVARERSRSRSRSRGRGPSVALPNVIRGPQPPPYPITLRSPRYSTELTPLLDAGPAQPPPDYAAASAGRVVHLPGTSEHGSVPFVEQHSPLPRSFFEELAARVLQAVQSQQLRDEAIPDSRRPRALESSTRIRDEEAQIPPGKPTVTESENIHDFEHNTSYRKDDGHKTRKNRLWSIIRTFFYYFYRCCYLITLSLYRCAYYLYQSCSFLYRHRRQLQIPAIVLALSVALLVVVVLAADSRFGQWLRGVPESLVRRVKD